jgi:hypothetical protein
MLKAENSVVLRTAEHADVDDLIANVAARDAREIVATFGCEADEGIRRSVEMASQVIAGCVGDTMLCLFGVHSTPLAPDIGAPWLIGTDRIPANRAAFLRTSRKMVGRWRAEFTDLANYVDARNGPAIMWLRWLGFTIEKPVPYGALLRPFHHFHWSAP